MADDDAARPEVRGRRPSWTTMATERRADGAGAGAIRGRRRRPSVERPRSEVAELKDRWLRERAELENFKKRAAREKAEALRFGNESLLRTCCRSSTTSSARSSTRARRARASRSSKGVELVLQVAARRPRAARREAVEARGRPFDPRTTRRSATSRARHPPNTVIEEHQPGYRLHDRLLRPALVTVGKGPAPRRRCQSRGER